MDFERLGKILEQLVQVGMSLSDEIFRLKAMEEAQDDSLTRFESRVHSVVQEQRTIISELLKRNGGQRGVLKD
jgi:hypothetical protein